MNPDANAPLAGAPGSASYRDQIAAQERFDALVAIRMERPGETRDSAISWAANMVELMSPKVQALPQGGAKETHE